MASTLGILLVPEFSTLHFSALLEPFRLANRFSDQTLFKWKILSVGSRSIKSSSSIFVVADGSIYDGSFESLFIISGYNHEKYREKKLLSRLRQLARFGCTMGACGTGAYFLASAGLLDGYKCTVHWEALTDFSLKFPKVAAVSDRYVIDRDRFTSGGAIASLDLALRIIRDQHGNRLAHEVSSRFSYGEGQPSTAPQKFIYLVDQPTCRNPRLRSAISVMEQNINEPVRISEIAERLSVSLRMLERDFHGVLGMGPRQYYTELRLDQGHQLLLYSARSIEDIALTCGFGSASAFARAFRRRHGHSPSEIRAT